VKDDRSACTWSIKGCDDDGMLAAHACSLSAVPYRFRGVQEPSWGRVEDLSVIGRLQDEGHPLQALGGPRRSRSLPQAHSQRFSGPADWLLRDPETFSRSPEDAAAVALPALTTDAERLAFERIWEHAAESQGSGSGVTALTAGLSPIAACHAPPPPPPSCPGSRAQALRLNLQPQLSALPPPLPAAQY